MKAKRQGTAHRSVLAAALLIAGTMVTVVATATIRARADLPERVVDSIGCQSDANGLSANDWFAPVTGVVRFQAAPPFTVVDFSGPDRERINGDLYAHVVVGQQYEVTVSGPASTACVVNFSADGVPANDNSSGAERLAGTTGNVDGTTRAASVASENVPSPGALTQVWYSYVATADGQATFTATPHHDTDLLGASDAATSVGVAVYDSTQSLLQVGGDGIASTDGGTGGVATIDVSAGSTYLIGVFSAGGLDSLDSPHGYTAAGAFTLSWSGPDGPPTAHDDVATVPAGASEVPIDVLANDTDPEGDPLQIVPPANFSTDQGGSIGITSSGLVYTAPAGFTGTDGFTYQITDSHNAPVTGFVTVYVGTTPPPPAVISVDKTVLDFGTVPVGKTKEITVTVTNISDSTVDPIGFSIRQGSPTAFDAPSWNSTCGFRSLSPGDSCVQVIRFWSVAGADTASPATITLGSEFTFEPLLTIHAVARTAPPVPPGTPNANPRARDDESLIVGAFDQMFQPLANDSDPDDDALTIISASDPQHGTNEGIVPCNTFGGDSPNATCIRYLANPGFVGIDTIDYTISDGRGGTASARIWISVDDPIPTVDGVTPDHGSPEAVSYTHLTLPTILRV